MADIKNREFQTFPLSNEGIEKVASVRILFDNFLEEIKKVVPESSRLSIIKTNLEEASFHAIKEISYLDAETHLTA